MNWTRFGGAAAVVLVTALCAGCQDKWVSSYDTPPSAAIQSPENLSTIDSAITAIQFTGIVSDGQDAKSELAVVWTSDLVGEDAPFYQGFADTNGATEITTTLEAGVHVVTLTVTDTGGYEGSDFITLEVIGDPIPAATVYIDEPIPAITYFSGDPIHFQGRVEGGDGQLNIPVEWTSNVTGALFVNSADAEGYTQFDAYLTAGLHNITLRAGTSLDPPIGVGTATVAISVTDTPVGQLDQDGDGFCPDGIDADGDGICDGDEITGPGTQDCNDFDASVCPGCPEICDGLDNDCDGNIDINELDQDGDGQSPCAGDCDDTNPINFTGNQEICDQFDNDCDTLIDDDDPSVSGVTTWYEDADVDGYGNIAISLTQCFQPSGMVNDNTDCDDTNPLMNPGQFEDCTDLIDNDCDGDLDCCDGDCTNQGPCIEVCDGIDNDCNGQIDEGFDADGDGYATCDGDCDDNDPLTYPNAPEICDMVDNDCDGYINEDDAGPYEMWETSDNSPGYQISSINPSLSLGGGQCSFTVTIIIPITFNLIKGQTQIGGVFSAPNDLYDIYEFDTVLSGETAAWAAFLAGGGYLPAACSQGEVSFSAQQPIAVTVYVEGMFNDYQYFGQGMNGNVTFQLALWDLFDIDYKVVVEPLATWTNCNYTYTLGFVIP